MHQDTGSDQPVEIVDCVLNMRWHGVMGLKVGADNIIKQIEDESAAYEAGLRVDDLIMAIDQVHCSGAGRAAARNILKDGVVEGLTKRSIRVRRLRSDSRARSETSAHSLKQALLDQMRARKSVDVPMASTSLSQISSQNLVTRLTSSKRDGDGGGGSDGDGGDGGGGGGGGGGEDGDAFRNKATPSVPESSEASAQTSTNHVATPNLPQSSELTIAVRVPCAGKLIGARLNSQNVVTALHPVGSGIEGGLRVGDVILQVDDECVSAHHIGDGSPAVAALKKASTSHKSHIAIRVSRKIESKTACHDLETPERQEQLSPTSDLLNSNDPISKPSSGVSAVEPSAGASFHNVKKLPPAPPPSAVGTREPSVSEKSNELSEEWESEVIEMKMLLPGDCRIGARIGVNNKVLAIHSEGAALAAGLQVGDEVIMIDQVDCDAPHAAIDLLTSKSGKDSRTLRVRRPKPEVVGAELYGEANALREDGNRAFSSGLISLSAGLYTRAVDLLLSALGNPMGDFGASLHREDKRANELLVTCLSNRSAARLRLEHFEEALNDVNMAMERGPPQVKLLARKGDALLELERTDEAVQTFLEAMRLDPNNAQVEQRYRDALTAALMKAADDRFEEQAIKIRQDRAEKWHKALKEAQDFGTPLIAEDNEQMAREEVPKVSATIASDPPTDVSADVRTDADDVRTNLPADVAAGVMAPDVLMPSDSTADMHKSNQPTSDAPIANEPTSVTHLPSVYEAAKKSAMAELKACKPSHRTQPKSTDGLQEMSASAAEDDMKSFSSRGQSSSYDLFRHDVQMTKRDVADAKIVRKVSGELQTLNSHVDALAELQAKRTASSMSPEDDELSGYWQRLDERLDSQFRKWGKEVEAGVLQVLQQAPSDKSPPSAGARPEPHATRDATWAAAREAAQEVAREVARTAALEAKRAAKLAVTAEDRLRAAESARKSADVLRKDIKAEVSAQVARTVFGPSGEHMPLHHSAKELRMDLEDEQDQGQLELPLPPSRALRQWDDEMQNDPSLDPYDETQDTQDELTPRSRIRAVDVVHLKMSVSVGVGDITLEDLGSMFNEENVVTHVVPHSLACNAGLQMGDQVLALNKEPLHDVPVGPALLTLVHECRKTTIDNDDLLHGTIALKVARSSSTRVPEQSLDTDDDEYDQQVVMKF